jgi:NADPH-dependent 2,4-dienoyl-CoA reductase/sulfur reductase-like enzyme
MAECRYLIVGGGMTAAAAVRGIREEDPSGPITIVSEEHDPPYDRPPLSKGMWTEDTSLGDIWRSETDAAELRLGRRVEGLDLDRRIATLDNGESLTYHKVLLATGGRPVRLPFGGDEIVYFRTLADYHEVRERARPGQRFAVLGGGFIGSEMAAALRRNDVEVTMVFPGARVGDGVFPEALAEAVTSAYRRRGVDVIPGMAPTGLKKTDGRLELTLREPEGDEERELLVDGVVAGIGIEPNVELARDAGLMVDDGIVVDEFLRARTPDVYAAGDVAAFPNPALGERIRMEHEDAANNTGRLAGRNMAVAGPEEPYRELPFFYSDLFDMGYEAVGQVDSRLETVEDWAEPYRKGVVYYLKNGRVRGVLLWDVWEKVDEARKLVAEPGPFGPEDLEGRIQGESP